ncbi:MAG: nitrile hydratase subunit alpha, partial [Chloroflexi bacterium]|nr:nitrile hydratase subunit alpha [Chloroflexota bacterium]
MPKVHDRGGRPAGPIDRAEHQYTIWEKRTDALMQLLRVKGISVVDETRRTIEALEPKRYESLRYYEKWSTAIESLLVEKGVLTSQEIDAHQIRIAGDQRLASSAYKRHAEGHDHEHLPADERLELGPFEQRVDAIQAALVEKQVLTADEVRRQIEWWDERSPALGAKVVARAWVDSDYKQRLLIDAKAACREINVDPGGIEHLVALENTVEVHHLVVCTLCSCYPRPILGLPPDWYKSLAYRSRAVVEPRGVLREFGLELPESVEVRVVDSTADTRYLVLPLRPPGTAGWSEDRLAGIVTRDCMIGV